MKKIRKDKLVYIDDILSAIKKINKFCKTIDKDDFMKNELLMDAVKTKTRDTSRIFYFLTTTVLSPKTCQHYNKK